jgi:phosphate transport system substrate-binding protein
MQTVKPIAWHFALLLGALSASWPAAALKINGSTTVNLPVAEAAEVLRAGQGMQIEVDTQGGSSGGISALGEGLVQIGMSSKPLTDADRAKYPQVRFKAIHVGEDAVALVVSRDVWEGGVRALSQEEVRDIYEGRITHWTQLGGPEGRIVFFNKEPGRGTWEVFAHWLYGDAKRAPQVSFPEVGGNEETRTKVASTRGALSQLSAAWADGERVFALGIRHRDGRVVEPTPQHIATHAYPMSRPLFLLTDGEPQGEVKTFVDFMLSERGQALVRKHGFLRLKDLKR